MKFSSRMLIQLLAFCNIVHIATCTTDVDMKKYPEDILMGPDVLDYNGSSLYKVKANTTYSTTLLGHQGMTIKHTHSSGYLTGFQWYNCETNSLETSMLNLQVYRVPLNFGSKNKTHITVMLVKETGWMTAKAGLNWFYFDEALRTDTANAGSQHVYIFAVVVKSNEAAPILYNTATCPDTENNPWIQHYYSDKETDLGDYVMFQADMNQPCITLFLYGIYVPYPLASHMHGLKMLSMFIAKVDRWQDISFSKPPATMHGSFLWAIRAEQPDQRIQIESQTFSLAKQDNCSSEYLTFYELKDPSPDEKPEVKEWDRYCGEDIFSSRVTEYPYLEMEFISMKSNSVHPVEFSFQFKVDESTGSKTTVIVVVVVLVILVLIVVVVVSVYFYKKKRSPAGENVGMGYVSQPQAPEED